MRLLLFVTFISLVSSCDPGYSVTIKNKSGRERNITVINMHKPVSEDSIPAIDSSESKGSMIPVSKDEKSKAYSFKLSSGQAAIIQHGIGAPDFSERVVVDYSDTVSLVNDKRVTRKKEGISTSVTVTLQ